MAANFAKSARIDSCIFAFIRGKIILICVDQRKSAAGMGLANLIVVGSNRPAVRCKNRRLTK
jgi:hypothetical protein